MAPNAPAPSHEAGLFQGIALCDAVRFCSSVSHPLIAKRATIVSNVKKKNFMFLLVRVTQYFLTASINVAKT